MRIQPVLLSLLTLAGLSAQAQSRPFPPVSLPIPTHGLFDLGITQPVRIRVRPNGPNTGSDLGYYPNAMQLLNEDGRLLNGDWTIPKGKTLVITDLTAEVHLNGFFPSDVYGHLMSAYPQGFNMGILDFRIPAGRFMTVVNQSFQTGLCFSSNIPPSFSLWFDPLNSASGNDPQLWLSGYLRDSQ